MNASLVINAENTIRQAVRESKLISVRESVKASSRHERVSVFVNRLRTLIGYYKHLHQTYDPYTREWGRVEYDPITTEVCDVLLNKKTWRDIGVLDNCKNQTVNDLVNSIPIDDDEYDYDILTAQFRAIDDEVNGMNHFTRRFSLLNEESSQLFSKLNDLLEECDV
jgi:hypothetical protein